MVRETTPTCGCEQTVNPITDLGWLLVTARERLLERIDEVLAPHNLTAAQYGVIINVGRGQDTPAKLCKAMSYDRGAMTRMLDRLFDKGLLVRLPSPTDRRSVTLKLTEQGQYLEPHLMPLVTAVFDRAMSGMNDTERKQLGVLLCRLINDLS